MKQCMLALALALPFAALAQTKPDPSDPKAAASPLRYESALTGYRPFKDEKPAPWKQVNEEVKGAAGHAAHAAPKPAAPAPARTETSAPPASPGAPPAKPAEHKH